MKLLEMLQYPKITQYFPLLQGIHTFHRKELVENNKHWILNVYFQNIKYFNVMSNNIRITIANTIGISKVKVKK